MSDELKPVAWRKIPKFLDEANPLNWMVFPSKPADDDRYDIEPLYTADALEAAATEAQRLREDVKRLVHERDNATKLFVDTAKERNDLYAELHEAEQRLEVARPNQQEGTK